MLQRTLVTWGRLVLKFPTEQGKGGCHRRRPTWSVLGPNDSLRSLTASRDDIDEAISLMRLTAMSVLFRPTGSTTGVDRGTVTTNSRGYFANLHMFRAWRDGIWKVRFNGTANYLPEGSRGDFVDVR